MSESERELRINIAPRSRVPKLTTLNHDEMTPDLSLMRSKRTSPAMSSEEKKMLMPQ